MRKRIISGKQVLYFLTVTALVLLMLPMLSCESGQTTQPVQNTPLKDEKYPGEPGVSQKPGIQNCHGYTWWMLTGVPPNSKSPTELIEELKRRGYRPYVYGANVTLKSGDVLIFENGLDHSGIVVADNTLSHYRITQVQTILRETGNLPPGSKAGDFISSKEGIITDPAKLSSYPYDYEEWLISHSPNQQVTRDAINKKKAERSFGFWHTSDTMEEVKRLLYPDKSPTITIWKLPVGIEIVPLSEEMFQDEERTFEAWFVFDTGPANKKAGASAHASVKVYWHEPGEIEVIRNGLVKGTDMKVGANDVKVSARIVTPWGLISDTIKPEYAGKDVDKWLEAKARLTVRGIEEKPLTRLQLIQQTTELFVGVQGKTTIRDTAGYSYLADGAHVSVSLEAGETKWNGTSFSHTYQGIPSGSSGTVNLTITGEVSPEADLLVFVNARITYNDTNGDWREDVISIVNVPLNTKSAIPVLRNPMYKPVFIGYMEGPYVTKHVIDTKMEIKQPRKAPDYRSWYEPFQYDSTEHTPYLLIVFKTEHIDISDDPGYGKRK